MQPGGQDLALVRYQQITRRQVFADVTKHTVFDSACLAMKHEQARGVARLDWRLRDQFRRKLIVVRRNQILAYIFTGHLVRLHSC